MCAHRPCQEMQADIRRPLQHQPERAKAKWEQKVIFVRTLLRVLIPVGYRQRKK